MICMIFFVNLVLKPSRHHVHINNRTCNSLFVLPQICMCTELVTFSTFIMTKGMRKKRKKGNVVCVKEIHVGMDKETISPRPKE